MNVLFFTSCEGIVSNEFAIKIPVIIYNFQLQNNYAKQAFIVNITDLHRSIFYFVCVIITMNNSEMAFVETD